MPSMAAWPTFTDGTVVHDTAMNLLSTNGDTLCQITTGKTSASGVSAKPSARVMRVANQSIANTTNVQPSWDTETYDTDNLWVSSTATQFTIQTAGKYRITVNTDWAVNGTGYRATRIQVNGTADANTIASVVLPAIAGVDTVTSVTDTAQLAAGATVSVIVSQNSGAALNLGSTTGYGGSSATIEWISP